MPKQTLGPFTALAGLSALDVNTADELDLLERMDLVNATLATAGCNCNGHAAGTQRDEYWGGDISELISRCTAHDIQMSDSDGADITVSVSLKLETLRVEIDSNREIVAWLYDES